MITKKQYVEYLISTPKNCTCTYLAEHLEEVSHDVVNDFLRQKRFMPREVWKLVKDRIEDSKEACLIVDDSVQDKRYSRFIELVRAQYSGNEHRVIKGIGVVNLVHSGGKEEDFYPIDYRVYAPDVDGKIDVPPPRPIATELAAALAGAVRRNTDFAAVAGRVVQPDRIGIASPAVEVPGWVVEIHWKEKGKLRSGVAFMIDVPAMDRVKPGTAKAIPPALREGPWLAAKVLEDVTFASWAQQQQEQRRANNESGTTSDIRMVISAEAFFMSSSAGWLRQRISP